MNYRQIASVVFSGALAVLAVLLFLPLGLFVQPSNGLDPSWAIGLNLAAKNGLVTGRDIIWTYGPLGVLAMRLPIALNKWGLFLWDIYILANLTIVVVYGIRTLRGFWTKALLFLVLFVTSIFVTIYASSISIVLFILLCFMLFYFLRFGAVWALILAAVNCLLTFYLKGNTGLPALAMMVATMGYAWLRPTHLSRRFMTAFSVGFLAVLIILAWLLRTDLPGYLVGQIHLANAYNDAMSVPIEREKMGIQYLSMAITIIAAFVVVGLVSVRDFAKDPAVLMIYALTALLVFLLFKNGFLRAGSHIRLFFLYIPAALGVAALLTPPPLNRRLAMVTVLALVFAFSFAGQAYSIAHIERKVTSLETYVQDLLDPSNQRLESSNLEEDRLPQQMLETIGTSSVDVIPWEIAYVYANDLNYNPRPVIQSQLVFDGYLDEKNALAYASEGGPDFVLYSSGDIDDRHPFFTESQTKLAMLANYEVASRSDKLLLLRRLPASLPITEVKTVSGQATLGEAIEIENTSQLQMMTANVEYSLLGKLVRFFYQPAKLQVKIEFPNGETRDYRAIPTILSGGVLINRFADSPDQAEDFFGTHGQGGRKMAGISFKTDQPWAFKKDFSYQIRFLDVGMEPAAQ